jgi:hypothetical protein
MPLSLIYAARYATVKVRYSNEQRKLPVACRIPSSAIAQRRGFAPSRLRHQPHFNYQGSRIGIDLAALRKRLRGEPFYSRTAFSKVHDSAFLRAWPVDREEMAAERGLSFDPSIGASPGYRLLSNVVGAL